MPPFTEDQRAYCRLAQFSQALNEYDVNLKILTNGSGTSTIKRTVQLQNKVTFDNLLQMDDINLKLLSVISSSGIVEGCTPLHIAGFHKHLETFDSLLKRGADFTVKNNNGDTEVHRAFFDMCQSFVSNTYGILKNKFLQFVLNAHVMSRNFENPRSAHGLSHFHVACAANHVEAVQLFLNSGVPVNESVNIGSPIFAGYTPLHFAARFCGYATAKLLLEHGADINIRDIEGITPLHVSVGQNLGLKCYMDLKNLNKGMEENQKITRLLLEDLRLVDGDSMGFCKIHAVSTLSDPSLVEHFLQDIDDVNCAVNLDSPTWPGFTALHFAVHFSIDTVKLLLKKGADIEAKNKEGETPLDFYIEKNNIEDLHGILSVIPALKNIIFSDNKTRLSDFIHALRSLSTSNMFFRTASNDLFLPNNCSLWPGYCLSHLFVIFSEVFDLSMISKYLSSRTIAMIPDAQGRTPLHLACYEQKFHAIRKLICHQLVTTNVVDQNGLCYLHIACESNNGDVVRRLLSQGSNANVIYRGKRISSSINAGSTPLHTAVLKGNIVIIKLLLKCGADVNTVDADGMTPIHSILFARQRSMGNLLFLSCNLENVVSSKTGLSHLHIASYTGNKNAVTKLLNLGADVNAVFLCDDTVGLPSIPRMVRVKFSGYTPLRFAIDYQNTQLIQLLLQSGADIQLEKPNAIMQIYDALINNNDRVRCTDFNIRITRTFMSMLAKCTDSNIRITRTFMSMLENDTLLQKRVEDDCGLTLLHIASFLHDFNQIEKLLIDSQTDVNAQIRKNSSFWPKATPLHILIECEHRIEDLECKVQLLLDHGADITLTNNEGDTPIHKVWTSWHHRPKYLYYDILRSLLRHHKDFTINPANAEGISHFHLACLVSEYTVVEKFLKNGVDVNLSIDHRNKTMTFQTPLRFLLESLGDRESRLRTVDVLLKYGADVNVSDEKGLTPLLQVACASTSRVFYLQKLHEAGANFHCTNIKGESVLEILLRSKYQIRDDELQFFIDCCFPFNTFNSLSGIGILSIMLCKQTYSDGEIYNSEQKLILDRIIYISNLFAIDRTGRTPIHNIVANHSTTISSEMYAYYIEKFIKMGYEIDAQDSEGKTALHTAAYFGNVEALSGLLISGADVNIVDNSNLTPLDVAFLELRSRQDENELSVSSDDVHVCIISKIKLHTIVKVACGLEIDSRGLQLILEDKSYSKEHFNSFRKKVMKELKDTQFIAIGTKSLTLRDFLSETGAVASRPSMTCEADRCAIDNYFESIDVQSFPHLKTVLKLQYRKALKRLALMGDATNSVQILVGNVNELLMPEICCRTILRFLSNTEIKHLIKSISSDAIS